MLKANKNEPPANKPKNIYDSWTFYEWIKFRNEIRGVSRLKVYPTPYVDQLKDTRKFLSKNCMKLVSILEDSQKNKPNQDMCYGIKQLLVLVDEKHKNLIQQKEKENNSSFDEDIMYLEKTKSDLNQHLSWLRLSLFECWE